MRRVGVVAAVAAVAGSLVGLAWSVREASAGGSGTSANASPGAPSAACAALAPLATRYTSQSVEALRAQLLNSSPLPPSMAGGQLEGIEGALNAYKDDHKDCMRKAMLFHSLAAQESLVGKGGRLWFYGHSSATLRGRFEQAPLLPIDGQRAWTASARKDVARFVETQIIPNLAADNEADREHWRRMYYGGLLACHATDAELSQLGGRRDRASCLDVSSLLKAAAVTRHGVIDPWGKAPSARQAKPKASPRPRPKATPRSKGGATVIDPWK
jgi:hypothetical protein